MDYELLEDSTVGEELALKIPKAYSKREVTGPGVQTHVDVDVTVQGRPYPPPSFGRAGAAAGPVMRHNASQMYRASLGGQATLVVFNRGAQQHWLPERMGTASGFRSTHRDCHTPL